MHGTSAQLAQVPFRSIRNEPGTPRLPDGVRGFPQEMVSPVDFRRHLRALSGLRIPRLADAITGELGQLGHGQSCPVDRICVHNPHLPSGRLPDRDPPAGNRRLREQIDLDALTGEVLAVVTDTVQPSHASLWLCPPRVSG
jgi:hypothetical protein